MDADDDQEVEDALEYLDPPPMPSRARDQWASGLQSALPEFLGETDSVCNHYAPSTLSDPTTEQARLALAVGRGWLAHG